MSETRNIVLKRRSTLSYPISSYIARILWGFCKLLFRILPRHLYSIRSCLLRLFGSRIGVCVRIDPSVDILFPWNLIVEDYSSIGRYTVIDNPGLVHIYQGVAISHYCHICSGSHDYTKDCMPLQMLPIFIKENVWIGTRAFVGPGVTINRDTVVGACSCVVKDTLDNSLVVGNPARILKKRA